ncbi:MAG TPA: serine protease [Bacteriovoracaceae bacterium]|nr:serine protease [Bacteriovoracaceae bacterium]
MKLTCLLIFLFGLPYATAAIIYGRDNRIETFASPSALYQKLSKSSAAMVIKMGIRARNGVATFDGISYGQRYGLCEKERFAKQTQVASCSGFLVAKDVIATAGHCIQSIWECDQAAWVFNLKLERASQTDVSVSTKDIYNCKKIIRQRFGKGDGQDYALIKLDRPVLGAVPVTLSAQAPRPGEPLVMIGHPSGLPQKITDGAQVLTVKGKTFMANVDAFKISSGSPVFNAQTGVVLGILVAGNEPDFRANSHHGCTEVNQVEDARGQERISSFEQFAGFLPKEK